MSTLTIQTISRTEDGGTGDRWEADWGGDYDGTGATIESALANLILQMGEALAMRSLARSLSGSANPSVAQAAQDAWHAEQAENLAQESEWVESEQ